MADARLISESALVKTSIPLGLKSSDVTGDGTFTGYAAAFGNVDLGGDIILPGAFVATLEAHKGRGSQPALLWSHDQSIPIGKLTGLREDRKGLLVNGKLSLEARAAKEAYALLKDGAVGGMSIGYAIAEDGAEIHQGARLLKRIDLHEVSIVAVPMNPEARITNVKAMVPGDVRDLQHALQRGELNLGQQSRRRAIELAKALWPLLREGSEGSEGGEVDLIDAAAAKDLTRRINEYNEKMKKYITHKLTKGV